MAVITPPLYLQAGSHPANTFRRLTSAMFDNTEGLMFDGDMAVSQNGTPNMSVNVGVGACLVKGDYATDAGLYWCENASTTNLTIATADATNPRRDLVVAEVLDAAYSGGSNLFQLRVVTGTPAASPSDPATPNSALVLARIQVNAGVTSIVTANITFLASRWNAWCKPQMAVATANPTSTTTTMADIAGATITISTPRANVTVVVQATCDMDTTDATTIGTCALNVDGSDQASVIVFEGMERKTLHQTWTITLAASGSHTFKLRFNRASGAGTVQVTQTHTLIALTNFW